MSEPIRTEAKPRLKFIDLARAIAILLMLEGHFVGLSLAKGYRDPENPIFVMWNFVRGFTAPLFFTVAGLIFAYLLSGEVGKNFFGRVRVRKGLRRAAELFFWGYVLQLSLKNFGDYLRLDPGSWVFAFHVLQCIGAGLLALMGIAAIQNKVQKVALQWWYLGAMVACLWIYLWLRGLPEETYVPASAPLILQNAVRGPDSVFPLAPWLCFAFLGGAVGVAVRRYKDHLTTERSCLWFLAASAFLKLLWMAAGMMPGMTESSVEGISWFTGRAAEVMGFLGLLRWVEIRFGIGVPRLLCVGRMTFEIYIVHVVILYGGLFGLGLNRWIAEKLNPWQAALGAVAFLTVFFLFAQALDTLKRRDSKSPG